MRTMAGKSLWSPPEMREAPLARDRLVPSAPDTMLGMEQL